MTTKSLLLIATLAMAGIASAKTYDIMLFTPQKAGSVQLTKGEYSLEVKGANAVFTNVKTGQSFTTPVKTENASKAFDITVVDTNEDQITTIELGGSTTKLDLE